jgi:hypothetical protein
LVVVVEVERREIPSNNRHPQAVEVVGEQEALLPTTTSGATKRWVMVIQAPLVTYVMRSSPDPPPPGPRPHITLSWEGTAESQEQGDGPVLAEPAAVVVWRTDLYCRARFLGARIRCRSLRRSRARRPTAPPELLYLNGSAVVAPVTQSTFKDTTRSQKRGCKCDQLRVTRRTIHTSHLTKKNIPKNIWDRYSSISTHNSYYMKKLK